MHYRESRQSIKCIILLLLIGVLIMSCKTTRDSSVNEAAKVPQVALPDVEGHGLAIRTHDTIEPLERVHEVIADLPAERMTDQVWSDHGIEVIRIREADQAYIYSRLPALSPPGLRWHGQAITWRNMLPSTVSIDNRTLVHQGDELSHPVGYLGLSGRGWSIMTIDGPRIQIELAPLIEVPGDEPEFVSDLKREFLIGPGDVLLLVGGSGVWPHPPPEDTTEEGREKAESRGTMGQLIFRLEADEGTGQRVMLIVPRFGESRSEPFAS